LPEGVRLEWLLERLGGFLLFDSLSPGISRFRWFSPVYAVSFAVMLYLVIAYLTLF